MTAFIFEMDTIAPGSNFEGPLALDSSSDDSPGTFGVSMLGPLADVYFVVSGATLCSIEHERNGLPATELTESTNVASTSALCLE
jgi:hypothetical protein